MNRPRPFGEAEYCAIEQTVGYTFRDKKLLLTAFTHSSLAKAEGERDNERLEFLGDAVLELVVTEMLFLSSRADEGKLTELRKQYVSQPALEQAEARLGLMQYLRYTGGENNIAGKTRSNLFEAVAGAIYLDGGLDAARKFLLANLVEIESENYKTLLQEYVQDRAHTTPHYATEEDGGVFTCTVTALGKHATGRGTGKKAAETEAAKNLLCIFKEQDSKPTKGER